MENSTHHRSVSEHEKHFQREIDEVYQEDLSLYECSAFYVATINYKIVGSVKITLWDGQTSLPLEKLFGIKCSDLPFSNKLIWQVGRLAISKAENPLGINLLKQLLTLAIYSICLHPESVMVAECDKKLLRVLNLFGIKTQILAPGIEYLGSETIPIYSTDEWLKVYCENSNHLEQISNIPGVNNNKFISLKLNSLL
jgi:hypothetical protein